MKQDRLHSGLFMLGLALVAALVASPIVASSALAALGLDVRETFPVARLLDLARTHSAIAALAVLPAAAIGVALGILITRQAGRPLRPLTDALVAASQAVPPVVVVALAFPVLGFGTAPTVLALIIYCIMPVLRGTAAALESAQGDATEAARAMGFTASQRLWQVEFPLAIPVIAEALRVAFILAIATAAVGALAGASTLGTPIIIGLQNQNEAYILQGAAATGALAFLTDGILLLVIGHMRATRSSAPLASTPLAQVAAAPE
jgi:osmoprotectant transport system permease protein